ncbi:MAG: Stp1/IreP family PP2C-type Ser/Thr phosphatase [Bacteroidales bacterium]
MRTVKLKNFDFTGNTDIGLIRDRNEDAIGYFDTLNGHVFIVCDGMGGHNAGDVASELAVETGGNFLKQKYYPNPFEAVEETLITANETVYNHSIGNNYLFGMGTTMVLLLIRDNLVYYGHAGDSRLYVLRNNILDQLTHDHSYVHQLIQKGHISAREAKFHPRRNEITKAVGLSKDFDPEISPKPFVPQNDDILLICSDGLTNMVTDEEIASVLSAGGNLNDKARALISRANKNGGIDNISVQLVKFHNLDEEPEPEVYHKSRPLLETARKTLKKKQFVTLLVFVFLIATILFFISIEKPKPKQLKINYSRGPIEIESQLIIAYYLKQGETLKELAERFNTKPEILIRLNPNFSKTEGNRHIKIPVKAIYKVRKVDELALISFMYDVPATDILKANNLGNFDLMVGSELIIPLNSK